MPPKKTIAAGANKNPPAAAPSKNGRHRTLTNKQQQLHKLSTYLVAPHHFALLVAQKNEKEEAAKQRALTDAIRSEQHIEEINGFHKRKVPGNLNSMPYFLL